MLDVEDLDLPNRCARVRRKGGAIDIIVWQTGTARLLPRLLQGRTTGPLFVTEPKARVQLPAADLVRARTCPAQLSGSRDTVREGLRRRNPAPAQALRADARRRARDREADTRAAIKGAGPATEPFRTLRRFGEVRTAGLRGSLAYIPVPAQPGCDLDAGAGSPGRVAPGDGDLRVRKSSVTDKIKSRGHQPGRVTAM